MCDDQGWREFGAATTEAEWHGPSDAVATVEDADCQNKTSAKSFGVPELADSREHGAALQDKAEAAGGGARHGIEPYEVGLSKQEAPSYVTYPYVLGGYRIGGTYARCARALFELHSETFNAWTMVWGSCLSIALLVDSLVALHRSNSGAGCYYWPSAPDEVPFWLLAASTLLHAPFSIGFHLFRGMGKDVYNLWRRLDQVLIFQVSQLLALALMWFVYESWWALAINMAATVIVAQLGTRDVWRLTPDYQRNRAHTVLFIASISMCYWCPMGVQAGRDAAAWARPPGGALARPPLTAAGCAAGVLGFLMLGSVLFTLGLPERLIPGVFDLFFSHPLMHVCATAAHGLEFWFVLEMCLRRSTEAAAGAAAAHRAML